ncbi:hypothetical protein MD537_21490, partial [Flavihumibacter sediminis]|nr:hypothetical protein [Flavihumibacter sediminis]
MGIFRMHGGRLLLIISMILAFLCPGLPGYSQQDSSRNPQDTVPKVPGVKAPDTLRFPLEDRRAEQGI